MLLDRDGNDWVNSDIHSPGFVNIELGPRKSRAKVVSLFPCFPKVFDFHFSVQVFSILLCID